MALPRYKSFVGVAKETTRTIPALPNAVATPSDFIPVNTIAPFDNIKYLDDQNWRGSMVDTYDTQQGNIMAQFDFGGDIFPDTIGYVYAGVLGEVATTGSAAPYTHAVNVLNSGTGQAPSYTFTDYNAYNSRQFAGCQIGSIDTKFSAEGILEYSATAVGFQSTNSATVTSATSTGSAVTYTVSAPVSFYKGQSVSITGNSAASLNLSNQTVTAVSQTSPYTFTIANAVAATTGTGGTAAISTPTPSYTGVTIVPAWTGVTTIGGTVTAKLAEGNVNITRTLTPIFTVDGAQAPYQIFQGAVNVEGSLKLIFEDDTDLTRYLTNSQPSLDINFSQGSGASLVQVKLTMTKAAFQVAKVDRSKDYVELDVTYKALANTTDIGSSGGYSPIKVTLKNAKASGTYA